MISDTETGDGTWEPAPEEKPTRPVCVELSALTRACWGTVVRVPAGATAAQLEAVVDRFYEEIDGGDYVPDNEYWEKGPCYADAARPEPDQIPAFTAVFDETGQLARVEPIPISDRIKERLRRLAEKGERATRPCRILINARAVSSGWISGNPYLLSSAHDRAFVFRDREQAEALIAKFPEYFKPGTCQIVQSR